MARIQAIGKHFKTAVLGYDIEQKLTGGFQTDVTFESHKVSCCVGFGSTSRSGFVSRWG